MKKMMAVLIACIAGGFLQNLANAAQSEKVLYSFCGQKHCADGAVPGQSLVYSEGVIYGTTYAGGAGRCGSRTGCGTVFALDPKTGAERVLYSFCSQSNCADGKGPETGLTDVNGKLYGTTSEGGGSQSCYNGCGTVLSLDPSTGAETVLHAFCSEENCADGADPHSTLTLVGGALIGTTVEGGSDLFGLNGSGTVYAINPDTGAETVVYAFCSQKGLYCADGWEPAGGVTNVNGLLYGTTLDGGAHDYGAVFAVNPRKGSEKLLYSFCSQADCVDGERPVSGLTLVDGLLYGAAYAGGASGTGNCYGYGCGVIFALNPDTGAENVAYSFCSRQKCRDGATPESDLIDVSGVLYGTTVQGGSRGCENHEGCGTAFSLAPESGSEKVLYSFCADRKCSDGQTPYATLKDVHGALYGTTNFGGAYGYGAVVAITP
jgi:uncharacterized repeat protein (TIGR03803 family)